VEEDIDAVIASLRAHEIERLRANGEKRDIIFEESHVIVTGVPRPKGGSGKWKDETFQAFPNRYATARTVAPRNDIGTPAPAPAPLEWTKVQTQFSPPDERSCGNQLHVRDHAGQTWVIPLNGDPDVQARRLLREKFGKSSFNAPIHYLPRSYH
jgi:hypothetical protein